jgi:hypothetical protein
MEEPFPRHLMDFRLHRHWRWGTYVATTCYTH